MNSAWIHRGTALLVVLLMSLIGGSVRSQSQSERLVSMMDACDPTTFNAVIGPGACVRPGGVRFDDFIAELTRRGEIGECTSSAPSGRNASFTALAMAAGGAMAPPSPMPLTPNMV